MFPSAVASVSAIYAVIRLRQDSFCDSLKAPSLVLLCYKGLLEVVCVLVLLPVRLCNRAKRVSYKRVCVHIVTFVVLETKFTRSFELGCDDLNYLSRSNVALESCVLHPIFLYACLHRDLS